MSISNLISVALSNEFNLATFIVGILSLGGVIVNIIVTASTNKKKRYTDLITSNRVTTMQNLKQSLSNCFESIYSFMTPNANLNEEFKKFEYNKSQIFYAINYKGTAEIEMRETLNALNDLLFNYVLNVQTITKKEKEKIFETLKTGIEYLQTYSTIYCKCEWERAKNTSLFGDKEKYDTESAVKNYLKEFETELKQKKEILTNNTFSKIVKNKN